MQKIALSHNANITRIFGIEDHAQDSGDHVDARVKHFGCTGKSDTFFVDFF
jgi:hypothetical protein